ncbi:MAG: HD domain-containing protein [Methanothrix sp.]|nr:HD domain-containing protein [Methanothrix sp.]
MFSRKSFDAESMTEELKIMYERADPAHDFSHIMRVYRNAQIIGEREGADMQVLLLAALLHDAGSESKLSEGSTESESPSLKMAEDFLKKKGLPEDVRKRVLYAVEVHRFSKGIVPATLEARILQDADRLDALGAIGIARVFLTGGALGRALYSPVDPFCRSREPDDQRWNLDHFFRKLLKLESGMHTRTARKLAARRADVLKRYLSDLQEEIGEEMEDEETVKSVKLST